MPARAIHIVVILPKTPEGERAAERIVRAARSVPGAEVEVYEVEDL